MAYFALLWKARTIEKYRRNYESEKINSIMLSNTQMPKRSLSQKWRHYRCDTQKRISRTFRKWYPEGSSLSNLFFYLKTDQTFPNFVLKSVLGFVGGIVLTYLCFMFFVFQLSISLIHATIMSSIIGVLLTLGLAFSYRIRCLVFLLIPQFFSRVGRYSLTCYALVLILTGPATNTLKNSEVLSESLACGQEQVKSSVNQINSLKKPLNGLKDSIKLMVDRLKEVVVKVHQLTVKMNRLVLNIAQVIKSGFLWLNSLSSACNKMFGTPYQNCIALLKSNNKSCRSRDGSQLCDAEAKEICSKLKPKLICVIMEHLNGDIVPVIKKRLRNFSDRLTHMFKMQVHIHHSYSFSSNTSRTASQVAAGIVTEIRRRADPLLTWLSWSSCVTSLFLLLIIFRAKYYQHMFETSSRFDNRYITKEIRSLDLKRLREGRETILPLNRRERAKYVTTTSFRLVASEKLYLNRSVVFMAITTFKLLIHIVADYSLYWVLMTMRHHGRFQTSMHSGLPNAGMLISGAGPTADLLKSILSSLGILLEFPATTPISCLPNPYPPDLKRYTQIGILIFLLWFFAMFEPYGLRLRHVVMGHYQPDRAKSRAVWLYNHILRTRGGFMKLARRKLHRVYKYRSEEKHTFELWLDRLARFSWLRSLLGTCPEEQRCLLCGTVYYGPKADTELIRCKTSNCPGIYCASCFTDIGELCTICLSPKDYGDLSDVSLEKGSSDESDDDEGNGLDNSTNFTICEIAENENTSSSRVLDKYDRGLFLKENRNDLEEKIPLLPKSNHPTDNILENKDGQMNSMKKITVVRQAKLKANHYQCSVNEREQCKYCQMYFYKTLVTEKISNDQNHTFESRDILKSAIESINMKALTSKHTVNNNTTNVQWHRNKVNDMKTNNRRKGIYRSSKKRNSNIVMQGAQNKRGLKTPCKTLSKLVFNSSKYYIGMAGNFVKVQKNTLPTKVKRNASKIFPKSKKRQKVVAPVQLHVNKKAKKGPKANCRKNMPDTFAVNNSCHCACDHSDIVNFDKLKKKKGKKKSENISINTSESSCACLRKIRMFFSDVMQTFRANAVLRKNHFNNSIPSGVTKNRKRRKKKLCEEEEKGVDIVDETFVCDKSENYRITAYLNDQDWMKNVCKCKMVVNNDGDCDDADISEALAIIKSRSNNLVNNRHYHKSNNQQETKKHFKYKIQGCPAKEMYSPWKTPHFRRNKNETTFSELWKKIGFDVVSDSSSASFLKNVYRRTNEIFTSGRRIENISSPKSSRRLKYYESLGNDDFDRMHEMADDSVMNSYVPIKREGISVKKYPHKSNLYDRIHVISSTSFKRAAETRNKQSCVSFCKKLSNLKACISEYVQSSCGHSLTFLKSICCKKSTKGQAVNNEKSTETQKENTNGNAKNVQTDDGNLNDSEREISGDTKGLKKERSYCSKLCNAECKAYNKLLNGDLKNTESKQNDVNNNIATTIALERVESARNDALKDAKTGEGLKLESATKTRSIMKVGSKINTESRRCSPGCSGISKKEVTITEATDTNKPRRNQVSMTTITPNRDENLSNTNTLNRSDELNVMTKVNKGTMKRPADAGQMSSPQRDKSTMTTGKAEQTQEAPPEQINPPSNTHGTQALCTCKNILRSSHPSKSTQVTKRSKSKSVQVQNTEEETRAEVKSTTSSESVDSVDSNCPCNGSCSDPETGERNKTCTCATQYLEEDDSTSQMRLLREFMSTPDDKLDKEVYEFTSISCFNSNEKFSSSVDTNDVVHEPYTDPTFCCLAYIDNSCRRTRRKEVNVVTKANQCTGTDKPRYHDVSTVTQDWWSPIFEKRRPVKETRFDRITQRIGREIKFDLSVKGMDRKLTFDSGREILLEKKGGGYMMGDQVRETEKRTRVTMTDGKTVTFRSRAQIIPAGVDDVLSPSRYLLESQRYYNELFCTKYYAPHVFPVSVTKTSLMRPNSPSSRVPRQTRKNHKTKRLKECYSPRKQVISPRRRLMGYEWTRANENGDNKSHRNKMQRSNTTSSCSKKIHHESFKKLTCSVLNKIEKKDSLRC